MTHVTAVSHEKDRETVVQQLMRESETPLPYDMVESIFSEEYLRLAQAARIKGFLNLLTYRAAMKRLRERAPIKR